MQPSTFAEPTADKEGWTTNLRSAGILLSLLPLIPALVILVAPGIATGAEALPAGNIVINEIMYHPPHDLDDLQYVELHNRGASAVNLAKWSFTKGVKFTFPETARLEAGAYLVVCRNLKAFTEQYGANLPAVGDFGGKLSHGGENIELSNAAGKVVDAVKFSDKAPWPRGPDGYAAALERISPQASSEAADNWAGSALPEIKKPVGTPGRKNDSFSENLPPAISPPAFKSPLPGQKAEVTVEIADADGVQSASLLWAIAKSRGAAPETEAPLTRAEGNATRAKYQALLPAQPADTLVRFRIKAVDAKGNLRFFPGANEPRPTLSYSTFVNTNDARIAFAQVMVVDRPARETRFTYRNRTSIPAEPTRGNGAFIYIPPDHGEVLTFDHVWLRPRGGGFKAHFHKDQPFKEMTGINVIFESSPRWVLAEPLAYEVYRLTGVPACLAEHVRVWIDGKCSGYELLIEQPNKSFLARNQRDDTGNLYKLLWYGRGLTGQHEKKTHLDTGHEDLAALVQGLEKDTNAAAQWEFIQKNFNVEEFVNYYAVNMCIQNWDGFHNNYFTYHDTGKTGKWEIYPWDEDKTWGDYDGASANHDWYEMPLVMGMKGNRPGFGTGGFYGGASWWRPGGWLGAPLLANPEFRRRFLDRLEQVCANIFTEARLVPIIDALEKRLEPEVAVRARAFNENPAYALKQFQADIQSFRNQVKYRRQFILKELPPARKAVGAIK